MAVITNASPATSTLTPETSTPIRRAVWAGALGTLVEYFDYTIYAFLATTLATLFFPASGAAALLYTFAVFGVAFVVRPLGGIVLGAVADRYGRRPSLMISVVGMIGATSLIGLLPTHSTIGAAAPFLLCILRFIQGFSAGGEMGGAAAYVAEVAPDARRGALTSTTQVSVLVGTLTGAATVALLHTLLSQQQLLAWGWRIPFLLSLPLGVIALLVRNRIQESSDFARLSQSGKLSKAPLLSVLKGHSRGVASIACLGITNMAAYYLVFTYLVTYFEKQGIMSARMANWSSTVAMIVAAAAIYPLGILGDRIGRKPLLIGVTVANVALTYPLFLAMNLSAFAAIAAQIALGIFEAAYMSVIMATYCERFPTSVRTTGISLGINIAAVIAGGTTPYIATWLIINTGNPASPSWILISVSLISLFVSVGLKETAREPLEIQ